MLILPSKRYYVYLLKHSDDQVFYVGKGTSGRVFEHASEARRGCQCRKCETMRAIWNNGDTVHIEIVFESDSPDMARIEEMICIERYGSPVLTNKNPSWSGTNWRTDL